MPGRTKPIKALGQGMSVSTPYSMMVFGKFPNYGLGADIKFCMSAPRHVDKVVSAHAWRGP